MLRYLLNRVFCIGIVSSFGLFASPEAQADEVSWQTAPQKAVQISRKSARPILVYLGAGYCGYCRRMEQTTWRDAAVDRIVRDQYVPLKIDAERDAKLVKALGIQTLPTVFVVSPAAGLLGRVDGYAGPAEMQRFLLRHGQPIEMQAALHR